MSKVFNPLHFDAATFDSAAFQSIADLADETDASGEIATQAWTDLCRSGYLGLFHPTTVGGSGADVPTQAAGMEALARACSGTYWTATVSSLLCANLVRAYGDARHHPLLRALVAGERLAAFAIVETAAGSDPSTYETFVRQGEHSHFIVGEKSRITNAPRADIAVTLARRERVRTNDGPEWCLAFVDLNHPTVSRYEIPHMGLRGMPWGGFVMDGTPVADSDVIPVPFDELARAMTWGWLLVSVAAIGTAQNALDASLQHARRRVSFGRALIHMEGVQAQLADSHMEIEAARRLFHRALAERSQGSPQARPLVGALKVYATEMAVQVTQRAVQIHGALGVTTGHEVERYYRDAQMNVVGAFATNRLREQLSEWSGAGESTLRPFDWLPAAYDATRNSVHQLNTK